MPAFIMSPLGCDVALVHVYRGLGELADEQHLHIEGRWYGKRLVVAAISRERGICHSVLPLLTSWGKAHTHLR